MFKNSQTMHEKKANSRFESTTEILHQCKAQLARKSKAGQSDRDAQAYMPVNGVNAPKKQAKKRKQKEPVGGKLETSSGGRTN